MKTRLICLCIVLLGMSARAQENAVALYGGYAFGTGSATASSPTGWKINATYDFTANSGSWSIGGSVGYIRLSGSQSTLLGTTSYTISAIPIALVPKFNFGSDSFKGYLKGLIGSGVTTVSVTGTALSGDDTKWGMSFGFGAGANYFINDKVFLSAEYEWLRMSNIYEDSGSINSATVGIGMKF